MRYGENALTVIDGIKKKLKEIEPSLPPGMKNRAHLRPQRPDPCVDRYAPGKIDRGKHRGRAQSAWFFLWHVRSALVAIITLPIAILLSFSRCTGSGLTSNIMSLGGIAIAIGAMVDAAIIMVENAHKSLEHFREQHGRDPDGRERTDVIVAAAKSVGRPLFFSLLVITVSFVPVFSLTGQEGRLFKAARLHQDLRDVLRRAARRLAGAGPDDAAHPLGRSPRRSRTRSTAS